MSEQDKYEKLTPFVQQLKSESEQALFTQMGEEAVDPKDTKSAMNDVRVKRYLDELTAIIQKSMRKNIFNS